jgi:hypothetical protein
MSESGPRAAPRHVTVEGVEADLSQMNAAWGLDRDSSG